MDVIVAGPGRAGQSLALRLAGSGHRLAGVLARDPEAGAAAADFLRTPALEWRAPLPAADLLVLAVSDDAIAEVAGLLAPLAGAVEAVVHLSGVTPVAVLEPLRGSCRLGSFHPLQTLPSPEVGAARLEGAFVAITAEEDLFADRLFALAASIGAHPFELEDDDKALYHAAATAAGNYPVVVLAMARDLFAAAGVDFAAARPLVEAVIENAFTLGPEAALTGPASRGDVGTVLAQLEAVTAARPDLAPGFAALARATARIAGTEDRFEGVLP